MRNPVTGPDLQNHCDSVDSRPSHSIDLRLRHVQMNVIRNAMRPEKLAVLTFTFMLLLFLIFFSLLLQFPFFSIHQKAFIYGSCFLNRRCSEWIIFQLFNQFSLIVSFSSFCGKPCLSLNFSLWTYAQKLSSLSFPVSLPISK